MNEQIRSLTPSMKIELQRLRNIVLSCDQQFGDFVRYCMAECEAPEDHVIDVNTWTFVSRPPPPKIASIGKAKQEGEGA